MCRILIIEDDREMNQGISYVLEKGGYRTASVHSIAEGKNAFEEQGADLILLDVNLPEAFPGAGAVSDSQGSGRGRAERV